MAARIPRVTSIAQLAPNMPEAKRAKLAQSSRWPWHTAGDVNEGHIFDRKFKEITNYYYCEALPNNAKAILWAFQLYRPLIEAVAKEFTYSTEKVNGSFIGDEAAGAMETTMRPLIRDSFPGDVTPALTVLDWRQAEPLALWPGGSAIHIIPSRRMWNAPNNNRWAVALDNHRTWVILGYAEFLQDFPVVTALHDRINDAQGWRLQQYFYPNHSLTNLMFHQHGSSRWVETGTQYRCDAWVRDNKAVCLWPIGVEILTADIVGNLDLSNLAVGWPA